MNTRLDPLALCLPLLAVSAAAFSDHHEQPERPSFFASQSVTVNAVVASVDMETREVVLNAGDGEVISFVAGDDVRNLDQVDVGDIVTAEYVESLSIEVVANEGYEPGEAGMTAVARAEKGQKPGMAAMDSVVTTATVEAIDIEANTFRLRHADGEVREYRARNPENLKRARVGDLVVTTVSSSVAISVAEQPAE